MLNFFRIKEKIVLMTMMSAESVNYRLERYLEELSESDRKIISNYMMSKTFEEVNKIKQSILYIDGFNNLIQTFNNLLKFEVLHTISDGIAIEQDISVLNSLMKNKDQDINWKKEYDKLNLELGNKIENLQNKIAEYELWDNTTKNVVNQVLDMDYSTLAKNRYTEILRKEGIIKSKDMKITYLIGVIRDKNKELMELKMTRNTWKSYSKLKEKSEFPQKGISRDPLELFGGC